MADAGLFCIAHDSHHCDDVHPIKTLSGHPFWLDRNLHRAEFSARNNGSDSSAHCLVSDCADDLSLLRRTASELGFLGVDEIATSESSLLKGYV